MEGNKMTTVLFEVAVNTTCDIKETVEHLVNSYLALTFGNLESQQLDQLNLDLLTLLEAANLCVTDDHYIAYRISKMRLTNAYKYFKAMFETNMKEASSRMITMVDINLIDFCHGLHHAEETQNDGDVTTKQCRMCAVDKNQMLFNLIDCVVYLQSDDVYRNSIDKLSNMVNPQNCFRAMLCGNNYSEEALYSRALRFSLYFADEILSDEETVCLLKEQASQSDAIQRYIAHPLLHIQSCIISDLISTSYENSKQTNSAIPMINMELRIIHEGTRGQTLQLVSSDDQSILMESLIDQLKNHRGDRFIGSHVCCQGRKIYLSGGEVGLGRGTWNRDVYEIDTIYRTVSIITQLPKPRRHHKSCCSGSDLYIAGGFDKLRMKRYEVFRIPLSSKEMKHQELPQVDFLVDRMFVSDNSSCLAIQSGNSKYLLDLISENNGGWRMICDEEFDAVFAECERIPDSDTPESTSEFSIKAIWYPDFKLPKP